MSMRDRMIAEINAEVARQTDGNSVKDFTEKEVQGTTNALVDALLGYIVGAHANERKAANAILAKLEIIIK